MYISNKDFQTHPSPLAKSLGARHSDQVNIVLSAECLNKLDMVRLVTVLSMHAKLSSMLLNGLGSLTEPLHETISCNFVPRRLASSLVISLAKLCSRLIGLKSLT
jgi:hypothetical protein